jgi:hypothetical protein
MPFDPLCEFCVTQCCFVVLGGAKCNGRHAYPRDAIGRHHGRSGVRLIDDLLVINLWWVCSGMPTSR